ncbi:lipopolysaccharide heptosyltransferase family protein [Alteromonadaceae bacterium M269]|nr:lipopolysaccharide heptosyltransferase family protein [Alteromonadaceae bacterium M269]
MHTPKNLCLLRLSAIGDVCHAVALVTRIRQQSPDTKITWVIGKVEYQLVKTIADVQFVIFDKKQGTAAYKQLRRDLAGQKFDVLFAMQVAFRANLAAHFIKAKHKVGFDWSRSKELHWLFTNKRVAEREYAHVLEGFMDFADAIGIPEQEKVSWDLPIPQEAEDWARTQISEEQTYVVISPAASKAERNWITERYAEIADYLSERNVKVVLCGGPTDTERALGERITSLCSSKPINLIGQSSLIQLLALLKRVSAVIAPDTGPAHMATVVGTPVIGLYAHSNPRRTGPYLDQQRVVSVYEEAVQNQHGKPWQSLAWGVRAKGENLMQGISVGQVKAKLDELALY